MTPPKYAPEYSTPAMIAKTRLLGTIRYSETEIDFLIYKFGPCS